MAPPRVVILGAGYAGGLLARALEPHVKQGKMSLTVVERRDGVHLKIGAIRASVRGGEWIDRVRVPLNRVVRNAKTVVGNVERVDPVNKLVIFTKDSSTDPLPYDVLVCCTGAHNHSPGDLPPEINTKDGVRAYMRGVSTAIAQAKNVVIVGGGASAVEYAGEIRDVHPDKPITIVSSSQHLLSTCVAPLKSAFLSKLNATLAKNNITVIRGEKVVFPSPADFDGAVKWMKGPIDVRTSGGAEGPRTIPGVDLVLWAASWKVNTSIYPASWLNDYSELFVNPAFQVLDDASVFAFGDSSSTVESKQAITIPAKVPVVVHNIVRVCEALARGKAADEAQGLRKYHESTTAVMYLPVTSHDGVSQWKGMVFGGETTAKWKGTDLFTDKFWLLLTGHKAPPVVEAQQGDGVQ